MKLIYLTAGAGGMFCGSCMHDNALTRALSDYGWDVQLVPTYTPIRTDEKNVSADQVLFGGINVYLQQKIPLLGYLPSFLDRFLDSPWLLKRVTSSAPNPDFLGRLAVSMLKGKDGNQRKEVKRLCKWIQLTNPGLVIFSNILIGGCIESIKQQTKTPIVVTLQGDDVFLDTLKPPYFQQCIDQVKKIVPHVDGFIVQSEFYRDYMSRYFSIPVNKIHVTPLAIDVTEFDSFRDRKHQPVSSERSPTIGYLARLAKEKGLHHLVDAFIYLKTEMMGADDLRSQVKLKIAGWLGPDHQSYADAEFQKLKDAGLESEFEYVGSIERDEKLRFLSQIDILSVPTEFLEPKGLYALEAMAAGVPVVVPDHGAFPELIRPSNGGILVPPKTPKALAESLLSLLSDHQRRQTLADSGQRFVHEFRNSRSMAESTTRVIEQLTGYQHPGAD